MIDPMSRSPCPEDIKSRDYRMPVQIIYHILRNVISYQDWLNRCSRDESTRLELHQCFPENKREVKFETWSICQFVTCSSRFPQAKQQTEAKEGAKGPSSKIGEIRLLKIHIITDSHPLLDHIDSLASAVCSLPTHKNGLVELKREYLECYFSLGR